MRAPEFWQSRSLAATLLTPLSWAFALGGWLRWRLVRPQACGIPVVCVGNVVTGGAGKTPVVCSLLGILGESGKPAHALSRGYGGRLAGPVLVDPSQHTADDVGDEALLLARHAPTWVSRDRRAGAKAAADAGARMLVMDDGFQNPALAKTLSVLVIDGAYGLGNGRVLPAGPLREPLAEALARADGVIIMGEDRCGLVAKLGPAKPIFHAALQVPTEEAEKRSKGPLLAFAGIGRPEKFFATLRDLGAELVATRAFADHHLYSRRELAALREEAEQHQARLITTEKDWLRLPSAFAKQVDQLPVQVAWQDTAALRAFLSGL